MKNDKNKKGWKKPEIKGLSIKRLTLSGNNPNKAETTAKEPNSHS
ncbi:MAG TPA: hypothetical protein PLV06_14885 [Bacteroidales bacterium]|nr:hypothetical protein [Bacteroidales bacterium]HPR13670.1 hypothetical protein [Bacteroidales bacterium]